MKKFYQIFISIIFSFLMISCSNLYQDLTTTTVELTPEFISHVRNTTTGDNNYIFAKLTCGRKTITKKIDISEQTAANGAVLTFNNLIVGKKGSVYIAVANDETVEGFKSETIANIEGTTKFTVQPNNQTKIKVTLNPATKYTAYFTTFTETPNGTTPSYPEITFTENSTITAPLPVGTTRWQINFNNLGKISYHGSFGEKIDVAKELMNYKNYFNYQGEEKPIYVNLEGTGESPENIKTPIVYCEVGQNAETAFSYTYKILDSETPILTTSQEITDYCFDNAGNLYFITSEGVFKIAYNHKENKYEDFEESSIEITDVRLSYDKAQNYLYIYGLNEIENKYLTRIQNPAGAIYKNTIVGAPESFWIEDPLVRGNNDIADPSFTVHNGILYVSKIQRTAQDDYINNYSLVLQKGSIESGTFEKPIEYKILSDAQNGLSGTTDIMYQDGSLYVIFRCYNIYWSSGDDKNYSTGGILKYDISTQTFDDDFGIKGFATESSFKSRNNGEITINYFAPTLKNETQVFYGPTKFVAIMPKKLVFLDQGADVEDKGAGKLSTKSRIVEYDLSTNTFSSKEFSGKNLSFSYSYSG